MHVGPERSDNYQSRTFIIFNKINMSSNISERNLYCYVLKFNFVYNEHAIVDLLIPISM